MQCAFALPSDTAARQNAGVLAAIHYHRTVDDDIFDADGELLGFSARGRRLHIVGMEYGYVRLHAVAQYASVGQAKSLRGE